MGEPQRARQSLPRRITVTTVLIFLFSICALSYYASLALRNDMERLLANQQSSTVTYVARELNQELEYRTHALELVAASITASVLDHPDVLQQTLESQPLLQMLFNSGVVAVKQDGMAVADVPEVAGRRGTTFASNVATHETLTQGKSVIGRAVLGRVLQQPLFNINVPIRDHHGKVIGALFGVINLAKPNFLDGIALQHYGESGGFLVIDRQHHIIVTATDKSRALQPVAAPGANGMIDKRRQGFLGSAISVNSRGVETLSSVAEVTAAGWLVVATLPTAEAFAPIRDLQRNIVLAAIALAVLAGLISWWVLRRQFAPLHAAVRTLAAMSTASYPTRALPIARQDEIGELIGGFNRLLKTLAQREEALQASEHKLSEILENVDAHIYLKDKEGRYRYANRRVREFFGVSMEEIEGQSDERFFDSGTAAQLLANDRRVLEEGITLRTEETNISQRNGHASNFLSVKLPLRTASGEIYALCGIFTDITERKLAEQELSAHKAMLETALANMSDAVFISDVAGNFLHFNDAFASFHKFKGKGECPTKSAAYPDILEMRSTDGKRMPRGQWAVTRALRGESATNIETALRRTDTGEAWIGSFSFAPIRDPRSVIVGAVVTARDITEIKQIEKSLRSAKEEAERANQAKSRFLAAASHDLRQPLAALSIYVDALQDKLNPADAPLVTNLKSCVASLTDMLTKLLDLSKLEAGAVIPRTSDFFVDNIIASVVSSERPSARLKGLALRSACFGLIGRTDAVLFRRIIENFVSNAIRYTEQGGVLIGCRRHQGKAWVEIWDTGIGIPDGNIAEIFEEFKQLDNQERNRAKGTGLGLAIVARTAALLGLQIRVCSRLGKGSLFAVEMPLGDAVQPLAPRAYTHRPRRIALVEDNAEVLVALAYALTNVGHQVISATSGAEILPRLEGFSPDIVISDYRLAGDETGFDVIASVRALFSQTLPALIITGDTDPNVIRHMAAEQIQVQHKPFDLETLRSRIADLTAGAFEGETFRGEAVAPRA